MNFINDIKNSLYSPFFYASLKERKFSRSFGYFFSLIGLLSVVMAFVFGVELSQALSAGNLRKFSDFYPKELNIQIQGGAVSTNVAEPYGIKERADFPSADKYTNTVVIDTKNTFSVDAFKKYDARILIGKNFIVIAKSRSRFEFDDLSRMPDFSLSQQRIFHWIDLIESRHLLFSLGLFAGLFLSFFGFFTIKLAGLLIIALPVLFFGKLKKAGLSYKNSYQIVLHAVTVPLIIQTIFILGGIGVPLPFFYSLIALIIAFANIRPGPSLAE